MTTCVESHGRFGLREAEGEGEEEEEEEEEEYFGL